MNALRSGYAKGNRTAAAARAAVLFLAEDRAAARVEEAKR